MIAVPYQGTLNHCISVIKPIFHASKMFMFFFMDSSFSFVNGFAILFLMEGSVSTKTDNCPNERVFIVGCVRFVLHGYPCSGYVWH